MLFISKSSTKYEYLKNRSCLLLLGFFHALTDVQTECQMQCLEVTLTLEECWNFEDFLALDTAIAGDLYHLFRIQFPHFKCR